MHPVSSISYSNKCPPKPAKKRTSVACYNCRSSKVKCAPNADDSRCQRCIERNLECRKGPVGTLPELQVQGALDRDAQGATPPMVSQSSLHQYDPPVSVAHTHPSGWLNTTFVDSVDPPMAHRDAFFPDSYYSTAASYSLESGASDSRYNQPVYHYSDSSPSWTGGTVGHGSSHIPMSAVANINMQGPPVYGRLSPWDALSHWQRTHDQPVATDEYQGYPLQANSRIPPTY